MSIMKPRRRNWLIDSEIQVGLSIRLALCLAAYSSFFLAMSLIDPITTLFTARSEMVMRQAAAWELHRFLTTTAGPMLLATACMILQVPYRYLPIFER